MIRPSDIVRVIENSAIKTGATIGHAAGTFYADVSREYRARQLYAAETAPKREKRMKELRTLVENTDKLLAQKHAAADLQAELEALRAQVAELRKAQRRTTKAAPKRKVR